MIMGMINAFGQEENEPRRTGKHTTTIVRPEMNNQYMAGKELMVSSRNYYIGIGAVGVGTIIQLASAFNADPSPAVFGTLISLGGIILMIESRSHIGKAGRYLMNSSYSLGITSDGIGLKVRL